METLRSVIFVLLLFDGGNSYNILCPFPTISHSHFSAVEPLLKGLAEKGHNVTAISRFPSRIKSDNFRQILLPAATAYTGKSDGVVHSDNFFSTFKIYSKLIKTIVHELENMLLDSNVQNLMQGDQFDLVIIEGFLGYAALGFGAHFKCPIIMFSSLRSFFSFDRIAGNPFAISYTAHHFIGQTEPLNFFNRVANMFWYFVELYYLENHNYGLQKSLYKRYFPSPRYPVFDDMLHNISLTFVSRHFSEGSVRPMVQNIVEVSGIQIPNTPRPVSDSLQNWMNESMNGFIYFSFGTNFNISSLPNEMIATLVISFSKLSQNVLWKYENESFFSIAKNIRFEKWLPQTEVLAHKNIKLFITHGGMGSLTEAMYYGVPLIVVPMRADQKGNAKFVENRGWGIQFPFDQLNGEVLSKSIMEVLRTSKYAEKAKYYSVLYRDRLNPPLETAIYWTEYILRHRGAKHLQSNAKYLNFFQMHSLDVLGLLFLILVLTVFLGLKFVYIIWYKLQPVNKTKLQ